jgi:hypothetical protein
MIQNHLMKLIMEEELILEEQELSTEEKTQDDIYLKPEKEYTPKKPCPVCGRTDCKFFP